VLGILLLAGVAAVTWRLAKPRRDFLTGFASLLRAPERGRPSPRSWLTGSSYVGGEYQDRPVLLMLYARRGHRLGYLTLAMATTATQRWSGSTQATGANVSTPEMREARSELIGRHRLTLEAKDGWLTATWSPIGLFFFPGSFDADKWRDVLARLRSVTVELESGRA
jgi:hypothetical protein